MRPFSIAVVLATAAGGCWTTGSPGRRSPIVNVTSPAHVPSVSALAGEYRRTHAIGIVCDEDPDGWCTAEVEDVLAIRDTERGRISVAIELTQTNAHSCTFEGELTPVRAPGSAVTQWAFDHEDELEGPCYLTLERTDTELTISAQGCRYYCGARAGLQATFALTDRVHDAAD